MIDVPGYEVIKPLGSGGMAVVYLARDMKLDRLVAIKVLLENFSLDENIRKRFYNEAKVLARLSHPNIVVLHDYIEFGKRLALVMEYIEGRTLDHVIGTEVGPIPHEKALPMFRDILRGVGHAHRRGIIHRDLKPGNVLISSEDVIKVGDFGIAKIVGNKGFTRTGIQKPGTLFYMSPEVVTGKDATARSDIYALGMTLYEMLSGVMPLESGGDTSEYELMTKVLKVDLPDPRTFYPHIPGPVVDVLLKATSKDPAYRHSDCDDMLAALEKATGGQEPVAAASGSGAAVHSGSSGKTALSGATGRSRWKKILPFAGTGAALLGAAALFLFPKDDTADEPVLPPPPPPEPALVIADSIPCGPYFQDISRVANTPRGEIVVLDGERMEMNVFDGAGRYIAGMELSGVPGGGLERPVGCASIQDGRLLVSDLDAGGVLVFDTGYTYEGILDEFDYMAPCNIASTDNGFAGAELWRDGNEAGYRVCRWDTSGAMENVLFLNMKDISTYSSASRLGVYLDVPLVTASAEGSVYTALVRSGEMSILGFDRQGDPCLEITLIGDSVPKPDAVLESELERAHFLFGLRNTGWEPDSLLPVVSYMGVDSLGRLWLRKGTEILPVFDIYSPAGEHVLTLGLEDTSFAGWEVSIGEYGMLAWPGDTLQRQKVCMLTFENDPALALGPLAVLKEITGNPDREYAAP